jgi:hypothetical protein
MPPAAKRTMSAVRTAVCSFCNPAIAAGLSGFTLITFIPLMDDPRELTLVVRYFDPEDRDLILAVANRARVATGIVFHRSKSLQLVHRASRRA